MRVLFVSSGNEGSVSPIIKNQADSLIAYDKGLTIDFFLIKGKGIKGYLSNVKPLKQVLKRGKYDIVHSHYSLSAFVSSLSGAKNMVISLMGDDVNSSRYGLLLTKIFYYTYRWKSIIVKSEYMYNHLAISKAVSIPNGINCSRFKQIDKAECCRKLNWNPLKTHILFPANPDRLEKNFVLAKRAVNQLLNDSVIVLHYFENVPNELTPLWYNASDVVLLTSLSEGSPNVIKEAMACNCPTVSTNVGDVAWLFGDEPGYYLTDFTPKSCAEAISKALAFGKRTNGRERLLKLGLDSQDVAKKIFGIYNTILERK